MRDSSTKFTFLTNYGRNAMEETAEFRISRTLIVDEFHFDRFHWRDSEYSFTYTSAQAGQ